MTRKQYEGPDGAKLEDHSKRKHKILREYVFDYLTVRCKLPQRERFRLAIVDGFAGGGRYQCGSPGSPLIFIEELKRAVEAVNTHRTVQGLGMIEVECLLIFNDASLDAVELLKGHVAPMQAEIAATCPRLHLRVEYLNEFFEVAYPRIKGLLEQGRYKNVLFNLDQCGDSHVNRETIIDIMRSYASAEIFYTFMISSLLAFLKKDQPDQLTKRLDYLGIKGTDITSRNDVVMRYGPACLLRTRTSLARLELGLRENVDQFIKLSSLNLRIARDDRFFNATSRMGLQHLSFDLRESGFYCMKLMKDFDAITLILHHLTDAADLSGNSVKRGQNTAPVFVAHANTPTWYGY